jgi:subtilase family serine protease
VQDPAGLETFITNVSDPKTPQFRKHPSPAQFAATYGASNQDYQALQAWATSKGFTVKSTYPTNLLPRVTGTADNIQSALYVNLVLRYRSDGSLFVAVDREPSLDIEVPILQIGGLSDAFVPRSAGQVGTGTAAAYRTADIRNASLGVNSPNQALDGTGQVVGNLGLDTLQSGDVTSYSALQLPAHGQPPLKQPPNINIVNGSGSTGQEGTADVELVLAMASGAAVVFFHGSTGITAHADDALHAIANYSPLLTTASCSWVFGRSDKSNPPLYFLPTYSRLKLITF